MKSRLWLTMLALAVHVGHVGANDPAPWGSAAEIQQAYRGQKVVFDNTPARWLG